MKKNWKRMLSLLLTVCMIAGLLVLPAAAEDGDEGGGGDDTPATETYAITVTDTENGSVVIAGDTDGQAAKGVTITVTATADDGYKLDAITVTVTEEDGTPVSVATEDNVGTFEMPASDVTVTVIFKTATTEGGGEEGGGEEPEDPPAIRTVTFEGDYFSVEEIKQGGADLVLADGACTANTTEEIIFKVTADDDYEITTVEVDGAAQTADDGVYTIDAGESDVTVAITTEKITPPTTKGITFTVPDGAELAELKVGAEEKTLTDGKLTVAKDAVVTFKVNVTDEGKELDTVTGATEAEGVYTVNADAAAVVITLKEKTTTPTVNKEALNAAITAAETAIAAITVDTDAANVPEGTKWILAADKDTYQAAIVAAKSVADKAEATQTEVDNAVTLLAAATTAFEAAQKDGAKLKTMTVTAENVTATYDGTAKTIKVEGAPTGATITYCATSDGTYAATQPEMKYASDTAYTVYYKVTADGYEEATGSATITINKAAAPVLGVAFDPEDVPAAGGDVNVTVTATGVFGQDELTVSVTLGGGTPVPLTKGATSYVGKLAGIESTTESKEFSVEVTATNANYNDATKTVTLRQLGANDVTPMLATGLKVSDVVDYKALGVETNVTGSTLVYTIDEAALQAAWADADKKAIITGNAMNHGDVAYLCFTFEAPEGVDSTWKLSQRVDNVLEDTKHALNGTDTFDVWTVDGKMVIGDWFSIADIKGEELKVRDAATWNNVQYCFYEGEATDATAIVKLNVQRAVIAAPVKYTVAVTGGTANPAQATEGTIVTVTADAAPAGKVFDKWTAEGLTLSAEDAAKAELTFPMPAKDVALTATYKAEGGEPKPEKYTVEVNHDTGGNATADKTEAAEGDVVTLTITPNTGCELKNITIVATNGGSVSVTGNKFTMPASNVTVTVTFQPKSGEEPTLPPLPAGDPADVVPGNLGQIDENSKLPANGLATEYKVAAVKTAEGVTVQVTAATLTKHANAQDKAGFWIGFGMPIEEGKTYTYCLVENGVEGDPIASVPGRVQTVAGKDYNTIYFNLAAEDAGKLQEVVVKQTETEGDTATKYNVAILVSKLIDPLADAIAEAKEEVNSVETSANGLDVSQSDQWVTQADKNALNAAITAAEAKLKGTMDEQKAAVNALKAAMETFKAAKKNGARPNPVQPPAYGSGAAPGGSVSNNTVDKTSETLADGTKRDTVTAKDGTVTVTETRPNGTKTVTTTTPDGEITTDVTLGNGVKRATVSVPVKDAGNGTVAVIVKDDGTEEIIRSSMAEDGNVVFELNRNAKVKIVNNAKKFVDITNHWAKDYVDYVTAREFFNGVDATHFSPDTAMTRAMLATVLFRLVGESDVDGSTSYKDVAANTWYTNAVNWASKVGVVNGYPDGTFAPNRAITREELVVMFYRYAGSPAVDETASLVAYQDADQVSSWAEVAMRWAVKNGIINGKSVDTLLPKGNATRAEVSAVLQRYVNLAK